MTRLLNQKSKSATTALGGYSSIASGCSVMFRLVGVAGYKMCRPVQLNAEEDLGCD